MIETHITVGTACLASLVGCLADMTWPATTALVVVGFVAGYAYVAWRRSR